MHLLHYKITEILRALSLVERCVRGVVRSEYVNTYVAFFKFARIFRNCFIKEVFCVYIASSKHSGAWEILSRFLPTRLSCSDVAMKTRKKASPVSCRNQLPVD